MPIDGAAPVIPINPEHELKMKDLHKKPEMPLKGGI